MHFTSLQRIFFFSVENKEIYSYAYTYMHTHRILAIYVRYLVAKLFKVFYRKLQQPVKSV